jgi:hypothetical protein
MSKAIAVTKLKIAERVIGSALRYSLRQYGQQARKQYFFGFLAVVLVEIISAERNNRGYFRMD